MSPEILRPPPANQMLLGTVLLKVLPARKARNSMSPSTADASQTPESKGTSGLASVFKSLTGSKSSKSPSRQSQASLPQHLNTANTLKNAIYGGPPNYEQLFEQLKVGNPLADRLAAAESLRHAVQDYPLSGVTSIFKEGKDLIAPNNPPEARVAGFELLTACVQHASSTDPERLAYFLVLTGEANPDDFHLQLASVVELAKHGKDLSGFHYSALPLLTTWLRQIFAVTSAARSSRNRRNKNKGPLGEETNLALLFTFIVDVIKFGFNVSSEHPTADLIDVVLHICVNTSVSGDLKACIKVIDAIITYAEIPSNKLPECVTVLCSIHCMVEEVQAEAWRSISNLCKSHNGQTIVRILLDILCNPPINGANDKQTIREMRGSISVLEKLFAKDGQDGYPLVPFTLLMEALSKAVVVEHTKVETDILRLILSLFKDDNQEVKENVIEEDWSVMFDVVSKCAQRALETADGRPITSQARRAAHVPQEEMTEQNLAVNMAQTLYSLIIRIEGLLVKSPQTDFIQRDDCIKFFVDVYPHLPESCAKLVIDYYMEYRRCYPSDLEWKENNRMILESLFADRSQPTHIRLHALKAVTDVFEVFEMMNQDEEPDCIQNFVTAILHDIGDEKDVAVLQELVAFAVSVADSADENLFTYVIDSIRGTVKNNRLQSPLGSPPVSRHGLMGASRPSSSQVPGRVVQTPSNVATRGLVQIFMRSMHKSPSKSLRVFDELLWITKSHDCETDARVSAMKLLFRLRTDWANRIFLASCTESGALAASLYRTTSSLAKKQAADEAAQQARSSRADDSSTTRTARSTSFSQGNPGRTPLRTGSGATRGILRSQPLWIYPDPDALPEPVTNKASSLLASVVDLDEDTAEGVRDGVPIMRNALNMSLYLQTIISLLDRGCDWEVYSFILVHFMSQLTNQALFKAALPQIKTLRELVCEQVKNSSFHEPPVSSGLRKADVAICLFQILTMVMSYHKIFQKPEEDDIVNTFLRGIGSWDRSSKCCIHALSICCHELPASTSKALVTILQKMSQIITQSHVAIHILEFLACLARLPDLYVNFREEEYRIVFMMCFRYLQYVRDQPTKDTPNRNSVSKNPLIPADFFREKSAADLPSASDDLPQYVYALAYHVIIFWFLSLKLTDRAAQVSWITKNLVSTDVNGKEKIDEQAQVTLDFMQRVAYADVDDSAADPTFTPERFGEILKKRWLVGQSIVTIEQATRGGWAQITKRQPSGTSCYIIREKFTRPPPHQSQLTTDQMRDTRHSDTNVVLPGHLLLQLTASIPQTAETMRPIPLPDDDNMRRFVGAFDRNFTVDGHKVGVIYIGENQTQEVEILANIMGSSDYTDFLSGLGTLTKLKEAKFNTQGLDRTNDIDGEYAFCWRDRVTEIVFHVTTQMPTNLDRDPQCIGKKQHIGNDFVNIIFNNSGLPFKFDTFPSEFNYVNIVITPESRASFVATRLRSQEHDENSFYKVQVMSKEGFPEISPAAETKIISLSALPGFIRLLALNASVFSLVWFNRAGGEHVSSWRNRLREVNKLRDRYGPKSTAATASPPGTGNSPQQHDSRNLRDSLNSLRRTSVANLLTNSNETGSQRSSVLSTAETAVAPSSAEESIVDGLDFSRWA